MSSSSKNPSDDNNDAGWTQVVASSSATSKRKPTSNANEHNGKKKPSPNSVQILSKKKNNPAGASKGNPVQTQSQKPKSTSQPKQQGAWGNKGGGQTNQKNSNNKNNNKPLQSQPNKASNPKNNQKGPPPANNPSNNNSKKRKPGAPVSLGALAPQLSSASKKKNMGSKPAGPKATPATTQQQQQQPLPQSAWNLAKEEFPSLGPAAPGANPMAPSWKKTETSEKNTSVSTKTKTLPPKHNTNSKPAAVPSKTVVSTQKKKDTKTSNNKKGSENKKLPPTQQPKTAPDVAVKSSLADMFAPKARSEDGGDELQLLRWMNEGKVQLGKGHRQRIGPRKKKFSTLKKNVLKERLRKWQDQNGIVANDSSQKNDADSTSASSTVCVFGFAERELLQDQDEYEELVSNLRDMAQEVAAIQFVWIPRVMENEPDRGYPAFVCFEQARDADAAVSCWQGLNMGGQKLDVQKTSVVVEKQEEQTMEQPEWEKKCVGWAISSAQNDYSASSKAQVVLVSVLTEDDLEDDDCLEESLQDIRTMAEKYGTVGEIQADRSNKSVVVTFEGGKEAAKKAADNLGKTVLGGKNIVTRIEEQENQSVCSILLKNVLSEDDMEDEDCLEESLADLKELASKYGEVLSASLFEEGNSIVKVVFSGPDSVAKTAVAGFSKMVIGGTVVEAMVSGGYSNPSEQNESQNENEAEVESKKEEPSSSEPKQMYSGDKLIGESWAEMKRVPKIPNQPVPRKYATLIDDESVKPLLVEMLGELMRLQKRAVEEDKNTKTKRRLVMGLREVTKGIRTQKVRMVVMANNLDEYGAIDEKIQEILDLAHQESIPVFFEFSKRTLGKAIGKTIKVAVVGIMNPDGAYQQFKKLLKFQP